MGNGLLLLGEGKNVVRLNSFHANSDSAARGLGVHLWETGDNLINNSSPTGIRKKILDTVVTGKSSACIFCPYMEAVLHFRSDLDILK